MLRFEPLHERKSLLLAFADDGGGEQRENRASG